MPTLPMFQVDAFSDRPFAGNPAAVCPLEAPISATLMQDIAAENNLAETAFFHLESRAGEVELRSTEPIAGGLEPVRGFQGESGGVFGLRWFTPTVEVDLCGHATLASAFVLMTELEPARTEVTFRTRSGLVTVRRQNDGELVMDFPAWPPAKADAATTAQVREALGVEPAEVLRVPNGVWLAVLANAKAVRQATPDLAAVARSGTALCITAPGGDESNPVDVVSRYFAPAHGIPEDPVTGSSFCFLIPYWSARLGKSSLRARQVSHRGGEISCALAGDRVQIGGKACLVLTGTLRF